VNPEPSLALDPSLAPLCPCPALVWGLGMPSCPTTTGPPDYISSLLERVSAAGEAYLDPARKAAVRDMLRYGAFRPAGRNKPSSEYLLAAALAGEFPLVNGPVDANNAVSLEWGYPASVFDAAKTGFELCLRRGRAGESYVFNASGQSIDLEDLLCVCRREGGGWLPCGNPVKDAMETKVFAGARDVLAVVYAPASDPRSRIEAAAARFAELLASRCGAAGSGWRVI
jgi:DNA/RNA-binding domain of Phe-tRNA-synthetase-like protein